MSLEMLTFSPDSERLDRIAPHALSYLSQRAKNTCYDFVMRRFFASKMTKTELGRRIGKSPAQVNHMLASPGNWTIRTMAELLAGIGDEEFLPNALSLKRRAPKNMTQADLALKNERAPKVPWNKDVTASSFSHILLESVK